MPTQVDVDDDCGHSLDVDPLDVTKSDKTTYNLVVWSMRLRPIIKPMILISICCMVYLLVLHPFLEVDVQLLENTFISGYREGIGFF